MMKLFMNRSRDWRAACDRLAAELVAKDVDVVTSWIGDWETVDREIANSAAMLTVYDGIDTDPEVFVHVGQAIEFHQPMVWVNAMGAPTKMLLDRPGIHVVETLGEAVDELAVWATKLSRGIAAYAEREGPRYARNALWAYLLNRQGVPVAPLLGGRS